MAAFSVDDLRHIDQKPPDNEGALASGPSELSALAESLAAFATPPAYSRIVLVGFVRILEFGLVTLAGFLVHMIHVAPAYGYEMAYVVTIRALRL